MSKEKFELFVCSLGNGLTVCNKAVEENGDYKIIAHIAECGKITWYVNPFSYVPDEDMKKITKFSEENNKNWENWLASMPETQQYEKLLDAVPVNTMLYVTSLVGGLGRKIHYLKQVCYERSYF